MVAPKSDSPVSESTASTVSPRKRKASRANARHSTGPRTPAGKARSARNAVTHGIFARIVLDGENQRLFELLHREYVLTLAPQNGVELDVVNRIVINQWKIARCDDAEALQLDMIGSRAKTLAREEVEKVKAEYGVEDIHDDAQAEDDGDRALLKRLRLLEHAAAGYTLPACANLAAAMLERDNAIERMSRYQQRLQQQVHRCLAELEKLRGTPRSQWADLPPSPYLYGARIENDDSIECNQMQPGATELSNVQNEPTAAKPAATFEPEEGCDTPGYTEPRDDGPKRPNEPVPGDAEVLRQVVQLHQEHLDDRADEE